MIASIHRYFGPRRSVRLERHLRGCTCSYCAESWALLRRAPERVWNAWDYLTVPLGRYGRLYLRWTGKR